MNSYICDNCGQWSDAEERAKTFSSRLLALEEEMTRTIAHAEELAMSYTVNTQRAGLLTSWAVTAKSWRDRLAAIRAEVGQGGKL